MKGTVSFVCLICFLTFCKDRSFHPELAHSARPVAGVLPYFKGEIMDPFWPETEPDPAVLRNIRSTQLIKEDGSPFSGMDAKGQFVLTYFFFTSCRGICPLITANVREISSRIRDQKDLLIAGITVDPQNDTPEALRSFRKEYKITQNNWLLLTGKKQDIEDLARLQFASDILARLGKDNLMDFVHTENIFLIDSNGYLRGIYRGRGSGDLNRLHEDLAVLRKEAQAQTGFQSVSGN